VEVAMEDHIFEFELCDGAGLDTLPKKLELFDGHICVAHRESLPPLLPDNLTDGLEEEFIRTLWSIMVSIVDLGFGVHPVQTVLALSASVPLNRNSTVNGAAGHSPFIQKEN